MLWLAYIYGLRRNTTNRVLLLATSFVQSFLPMSNVRDAQPGAKKISGAILRKLWGMRQLCNYTLRTGWQRSIASQSLCNYCLEQGYKRHLKFPHTENYGCRDWLTYEIPSCWFCAFTATPCCTQLACGAHVIGGWLYTYLGTVLKDSQFQVFTWSAPGKRITRRPLWHLAASWGPCRVHFLLGLFFLQSSCLPIPVSCGAHVQERCRSRIEAKGDIRNAR